MKKSNIRLLSAVALAAGAASMPVAAMTPPPVMTTPAMQASQQSSKSARMAPMRIQRVSDAPIFISGRPASSPWGNNWPFSGKNRAQRQRMSRGFMAMSR